MRRKRVKAYLCGWCTGRRRSEVFFLTADLERHTSVVHPDARGLDGTSSVEVRYRAVWVQGRT